MNNIKNIRLEKGMKLKELSEKTNLSIGYLSHLERGSRKNPTLKTMECIAFALNMNISEVFTG